MLQSIERYMKQAIVDKEPSVSSAALTSSLVGHCYFIFILSFTFISIGSFKLQ